MFSSGVMQHAYGVIDLVSFTTMKITILVKRVRLFTPIHRFAWSCSGSPGLSPIYHLLCFCQLSIEVILKFGPHHGGHEPSLHPLLCCCGEETTLPHAMPHGMHC